MCLSTLSMMDITTVSGRVTINHIFLCLCLVIYHLLPTRVFINVKKLYSNLNYLSLNEYHESCCHMIMSILYRYSE